MMTSDVTVLIGHKSVDKYRERNVMAVTRHLHQLLPDAEIIVAEQDTETRFPDYVKRIGFSTEDPRFSASSCRNLAFFHAETDLLLFCDADLLITEASLKHALRHMAETPDCRIYSLYTHVLDLNESSSERYIETGDHNDFEGQARDDFKNVTPGTAACLVRRSAYETIGGYTPGYRGWGGEDSEIVEKWKRCQISMTRPFAVIPHLWHPCAELCHEKNPEWNQIAKRFNAIASMSEQEFDKLLTTSKASLSSAESIIENREIEQPASKHVEQQKKKPSRAKRVINKLKRIIQRRQ